MTVTATFHEAGNYYGRRRHYTTQLVPADGHGQYGRALCDTQANPVIVYDQTWHDAETAQARRRGFAAKPRSVAGMPLCRKCVKKAGR